MDNRLGAWICSDDDFVGSSDNPADFEAKARTFLCYLENVFGRFYEFKTRICDYDDIPESYINDWDNFQRDVCLAVKGSRSFNGICAVMHIRTEASGDSYVVKDVGIRPCAIEQSFFRVLMKKIAANLPADKKLVLRIFGIRVEFVETLIDNLKTASTDAEPVRTKDLVRGPQNTNREVDVITFGKGEINALSMLRTSWDNILDSRFPSAATLNNSGLANPERIKLIRRMISRAGDSFAQYLVGANDTTNYLPDLLNLDENELVVYKNGAKFGYRPEERRVFIRSDIGYMEVLLDKSTAVRNSIDCLLSRTGVRLELMDGSVVLFVRPSDFARRRSGGNVEKIELVGRDNSLSNTMRRVLQKMIFGGEKIVGVYGNVLVITRNQPVVDGSVVGDWDAE
jgi:hypothetical protein